MSISVMSLKMTKKLENAHLSMLSGFLDSNFFIRNALGQWLACKNPIHLLLLQISWLFEGDLGQILLTSSVIYMFMYQN